MKKGLDALQAPFLHRKRYLFSAFVLVCVAPICFQIAARLLKEYIGDPGSRDLRHNVDLSFMFIGVGSAFVGALFATCVIYRIHTEFVRGIEGFRELLRAAEADANSGEEADPKP